MNNPLPDQVAAQLSEFATATFGLRFPPDRWGELARGVASAALDLGIPDLDGWVQALLSGTTTPRELEALANHLTISETYFFRQRDTFDALAEKILPERVAVRAAQARPLRIWSAGCASGEEPYSIAMFVRQRLPDLPAAGIEIFGTDLNSHVLARAARGVFTEWSFRDTPPGLKGTFFTRKPNGRYEISPEIRRMVKFSRLNFAEPFYPPEFGEREEFDLILCRNVLMYFSGDWQEKIIARFCAALAPGGWLIVGPCDIAAPQCLELNLRNKSPGIFQKREGRLAAGTTPANEVNPPIALGAPEREEPVPPSATRSSQEDSPGFHWGGSSLERAHPAPDPIASPAGPSEETVAISARAQQHADRGELAPAREACDEAIALDPLNPALQYLRGCILQEQKQLPEAAAAFRAVLYLDPQSVMAEFALGCLDEREGRRAEARRHFAAVLRLLSERNRGDAVPGAEGLTVGRLRAVVEHSLQTQNA